MDYFAREFQVFSLLFARMLSMLAVAPAFGGQVVSYFYRVALSFFTALLVAPVVDMPTQFYELIETRYFILLGEQIFIGLFIGFALILLFAAFQMAGEFFSVQMGFGISEVMDPLSQVSLPLLGTIKNLMALLVFFASGAHLLLIKAVAYSYKQMPYFQTSFLTADKTHEGLLEFFALMGSSMFLIALKIALPVMGTLFLVSITLGMLSKAAPQMNILMLGFPLKILIAFVVLAITSPMIVEIMAAQYDTFFQHLDNVIDGWARSVR